MCAEKWLTDLVAEDQSDLALVELFGVEPERFVGDDEHGVDDAPAVRVHEAVQVAVDLLFAARVDDQRVQPATQPLFDLVLPILSENKKNETRVGHLVLSSVQRGSLWRTVYLVDTTQQPEWNEPLLREEMSILIYWDHLEIEL